MLAERQEGLQRFVTVEHPDQVVEVGRHLDQFLADGW